MAKTTKISANLKRTKFNELLDRNPERPLRINDTGISGFYLLVAKTGYAVWYLEKRISRSGKSAVTFRLGKAWGGKAAESALNVGQASRKANAWTAFCEAGKDPRKEIGSEGEMLRLAERERPKVTLDELVAHYLKKPGLSTKSANDFKYAMKNHLKPWLGNRADVSTLDDEEVLDQYHQLRKVGLGTATVLMKMLSAMWNYCKPHFKDNEGNRLLGDNPVSAAKQRNDRGKWEVQTNPNKPVITIDKIGGFIAHLEQRIAGVGDPALRTDYCQRNGTIALLLCLFTGMRISEALNLLWAGVDLEAGLFRIGEIKDAENKEAEGGKATKNRHNHTILMSGYVKALMRELSERRSSASIYVFPKWNQPHRPLPYPMTLLGKLRKETGIYFSSHAMRRTFRGVCRSLGIAEDDVARMLNHKHQGSVTDKYDPGAFNPGMMRVDWQRVAHFLETKRDLATGNESGYGQKAAALTNFLAKEGLSLNDVKKMVAYLEGEGEPPAAIKQVASL